MKAVGFRMAGFMLSGSGIRVHVYLCMGVWNYDGVGGEKYNSMSGDGGVVGVGEGLGVVGYTV